MNYIMMSLEDAKKVAKKDAIVLVAMQDLESKDRNIGFNRKNFGECHSFLENAMTIAKVYNDFAKEIRVFSKKQNDPICYKSIGKLSTILFP